MIEAFKENPILLLFIVVGLGYGVGSIKFRGNGMGVAAVLFVGLIMGSLSPDIKVPEVIIFLGLSIFVYTVGLGSGPSFFSLFRQRGFRDLFFVFMMLTFSASIAAGLFFLFGFEASTTAGLFAGSTTNTAALAGVLDEIGSRNIAADIKNSLGESTVVGFSLSYPMGVIGPILAIIIAQRILKINYKKEETDLRKSYPVRQDIVNFTIKIKNKAITRIPIRDLRKEYDWSFIFGRYMRNDSTQLSDWNTRFEIGDLIAIVGDREEVEAAAKILGEVQQQHLSFDQTDYQTRRFFVSDSSLAGQKLATLNLEEKYDARITRFTRGDIEFLANSDTVLELGDRVRVVGRREDIPAIAQFLGDSYDKLSKINLLSFGLGMALGLMLGMITFSLPGGVNFRLGFAGGPIIVGLVLGGLRRTGPINWALPYSANLLLQQVGLILLLAGVGVNSGHRFFMTLSQGEGGLVFAAGAIISVTTTLATLFFGYLVLKIPFSFLTGMVSNQPAILDFALDKADNKLPNVGFTLMMPVAIVIKIVYAQLLFALLA